MSTLDKKYEDYWRQFEILMPEGYNLSGWSNDITGVFVHLRRGSILINKDYVELLKNAVVAGRMDSQFTIKDIDND